MTVCARRRGAATARPRLHRSSHARDRALDGRLRQTWLAGRGHRHRDGARRSGYGALCAGRHGTEADGRVRTPGEDRMSAFKVDALRPEPRRSSGRRSSPSGSTSAWSRPRSGWSASRRTCRSSACTPRARTGVIVGGAGAFPFELTVPGAVVPTAGVTGRRNVPDAPPSRGAARDDARPARRRARARRAARAPVGVRGHDLRALRVRDGVASQARSRSRRSTPRSRGRSSARGRCGSSMSRRR